MMTAKVKAGPDWMAHLPEYLWDYPLSALAIPGKPYIVFYFVSVNL